MKKCFVVSLFLAALAISGLSNAEEEEIKKPLVTLEEVVVTATRDKEEIRKIPANVSIVTAEEMERYGATNIVEVLEELESINFRTFSGNASQAQIDMRGFGGDNPFGKTLIMLDGRRLNRPDMASVNWLQIPINNIERIEVIRGPSCVLYGDSAIAGVINIITKRGVGKPKVGASLIAGTYGLQDGRASITGSKDRLSYAITGEYQEISGYRERSEFLSKGGGVDFGYDFSDYFNISLGVSFNRTNYELPGALTKKQIATNRRQYQPGHENDDSFNDYTNTNLRMESILGDFGSLEVNFLYGKKDIENNMESYWAPNKYNIADIDTFGITPKYILKADIFGYGNKLIVGLDYYHETLDQDKYDDRARTFKTHVVELERNSVGYYIRDDFNILEELIISVGCRKEDTEIKGHETALATQTKVFDSEKKHKGEAYETGLTYLVGEKSKIFAKYAKVYRYPFLDEQASYYGFGTDTFLTDLKKEKGRSYEMGTQFYPLENLKIGLTLFRIDMKDEIAWNGVTFRNENLDETRHEGTEFAFSYRLKGAINLYGNFTYHDAKFRKGANKDKEIPLVPKRLANIGFELYLPYALTLRPEMRYVDKSYLGTDNDNSSEKLEDYTVYDIFLHFRPENDHHHVLAFLGVENLTDEEYSTMGWEGATNTYYPSTGRAFKAGISFMF